MRKLMVGIVELGAGAGAGDGSSSTGISTSSVPTSYGPMYGGKVGMGLKREKKVAIWSGLS
jgi:hypothetical protein